jgi:oligoribonuclease
MAETDRLVWLDLEMTGLDPDENRILEIAAIVTDGELEVIAEGPDLVVHQPEDVLARMNEWNWAQHTESGLVGQVRDTPRSEGEAEQQVLQFVSEHCEARSAPLAGNSIHQDRKFLVRYMPRLESFLHYRNVDVSTVKELVRRWYPNVFAARPHKQGTHRALDDIRDSIAELQFYRRYAFR